MYLTKEEKREMRKAGLMTFHNTLDIIHRDIIIFSLCEENQVDLKNGFITKQDFVKQVNESGSKIFTTLDNLGHVCNAPVRVTNNEYVSIQTVFESIVVEITDSINLYQGDINIIHALDLLKTKFNNAYEKLKRDKILDELLYLSIDKFLTEEVQNYRKNNLPTDQV